MNSLQVSLNKATTLILEHHPTSSAVEALETSGWSTLATRRVCHRCLYVYKSFHQLFDDDRTFKFGADVQTLIAPDIRTILNK